MIREATDMAREIRERMRDGKGSVEITHIFKQEELKGKARLVARITIPPGASIGFHEHDKEEEIYYIISGKGLVNDNGTTRTVGPGDAILTGGGAGHAIENAGDDPLEMMAVILLFA
ncbi:MAG TPA: cupin domain-containing protein [Firmicutes bacterium]|nr:cupin domain-containing protein [Bacillota bacterium]